MMDELSICPIVVGMVLNLFFDEKFNVGEKSLKIGDISFADFVHSPVQTLSISKHGGLDGRGGASGSGAVALGRSCT